MCQGFVCPPVIETSLEFSYGSPRQELHKYICKISLDNNLRSFRFMKYLVVPQNWFGIFIIFLWFWRILQYLYFYRKREKRKRRKKSMHGLGPAHNEACLTWSIQPRSKKNPTRRGPLGSGHFASRTLVYFKNY